MVSNAADAAIAFARAQIGKPYEWAATGPDSYDCSGLVQAAYASAGIALARTTYGQVADGPKVAQSDLVPGDLVFPDPGHVQIYTGSGNVVEAPSTGLKVREVPMWGYWTAVRVTTPGTNNPAGPTGKGVNTTFISTFTELSATDKATLVKWLSSGSYPGAAGPAAYAKLTAAHKAQWDAAVKGTQGSTGSAVGQGITGGAFTGAVDSVLGWTAELAKVLAWLSNPKHWIRVGEVLAGAILVMVALSKITNFQLPQFASKAASMAAFA